MSWSSKPLKMISDAFFVGRQRQAKTTQWFLRIEQIAKRQPLTYAEFLEALHEVYDDTVEEAADEYFGRDFEGTLSKMVEKLAD